MDEQKKNDQTILIKLKHKNNNVNVCVSLCVSLCMNVNKNFMKKKPKKIRLLLEKSLWFMTFLLVEFSLSSVAVHDAWIKWSYIAKCLWQSFCTWRWYGWIECWWRIIWLDHWNGLAAGHWRWWFMMRLLIPMHKMLDATSMIIIQINGK